MDKCRLCSKVEFWSEEVVYVCVSNDDETRRGGQTHTQKKVRKI